MKRLVLAGDGGRLGAHLRDPLSKLCDERVSAGIAGMPNPGERCHRADLAKHDDIHAVLEGAAGFRSTEQAAVRATGRAKSGLDDAAASAQAATEAKSPGEGVPCQTP